MPELPPAPLPPDTTLWDNVPSILGRGCNLIASLDRGEVVWAARCVKGKTTPLPVSEPGKAECRFVETKDKLIQEYSQAYGISGSGSYDDINFSGSAAHSDFRTLTIDTETQYAFIIFHRPVVTRTLDPENSVAEFLATARFNEPEHFVAAFGDSFVSSETLGQYLRFVFSFKSLSSTQMDQIRLSVNTALSVPEYDLNSRFVRKTRG